MALRRFGSMYWHCLAGQTVYPVQMAVKLKIPLIVWGAHQGVDQVGMYSHLNEVEMTRKYRKEHDLMGYEAEDLLDDEFDNLREGDIFQFAYPDDRELQSIGVRGIYLNNYIRWDTKAQHEQMIRMYDYKTSDQTRTFDRYNDVDCYNYSDVHDYIKYLKYGYGKVTDHGSREIRLKRMSREEAIRLEEMYSGMKPANLNLFLEWIGVTENAFYYTINQHRDPRVWSRDENWNWTSRKAARTDDPDLVSRAKLQAAENECSFTLNTDERLRNAEQNYILVGKGYPAPGSN